MTDEPYDVCFTVQGPNADMYLPLCLDTLRRHVDLQLLRVHLVNRGCKETVVDYMKASGFIFHECNEVFREIQGPDDYLIPENMETDTSSMCHWMVNHCGDCDVLFICHFDIEFMGDVFARYRSRMSRKVGQAGEHSDGVVGYRRHAIRQSVVTFRSLSHWNVREHPTGSWKIRALDDQRGERIIHHLAAFDIGELLELDLRYRGWEVVTMPQGERDSLFRHFVGGSGYCGTEVVNEQRAFMDSLLRQKGVTAIP